MFHKNSQKAVKDHDPEIIAWCRECKPDLSNALVFIFPKPGDDLKKIKYFAVKDYEKALFYNKGELVDEVGGGLFELDKKARVKGTEIVWFDTSLQSLPWGIPETNGIPTKDGFTIGLFGDVKLRIANVKTFYKDVVGGRKEWTQQDLKEWIKSLLHTSMRDIVKMYLLHQIVQEDREVVINKFIAKITEEFNRYGLDLSTFNVLGFKFPENAQKVVDQTQKSTLTTTDLLESHQDHTAQSQKELLNRIQSLKQKLQHLQDALIDELITTEEFEKKRIQITTFIVQAETELKQFK